LVPFGVKAIALTDTIHHITGRALIFVTEENKVYCVKDMLFSSRRPHEKEVKSFSEELQQQLDEARDEANGVKKLVLKSDTYMKYDPVIPKISKKYLSYDLEIHGLSKVQTFSTRLESTSQVFAYGHDLFLVRTQADQAYDLLDEDFNPHLMFVCIGALVIFDIFVTGLLKKYAKRKSFLLH